MIATGGDLCLTIDTGFYNEPAALDKRGVWSGITEECPCDTCEHQPACQEECGRFQLYVRFGKDWVKRL